MRKHRGSARPLATPRPRLILEAMNNTELTIVIPEKAYFQDKIDLLVFSIKQLCDLAELRLVFARPVQVVLGSNTTRIIGRPDVKFTVVGGKRRATISFIVEKSASSSLETVHDEQGI